MKTFYFIGGPRPEYASEFFRRLEEMGGPPRGWLIYPHVADTRALHLVAAESVDDVLHHLEAFQEIYERGDIVEVRSAK